MLAVITLNSLSLGKSFIREKIIAYNPYKIKKELKNSGFKDIKIKGIYLSPFSKTNLFVKTIISFKINKIMNLLLPFFIFFSHSFYIEAKKINEA